MLGVGLSLMSVAIRGRAADLPPIISITSGNGYAGSVYSSTVPGQWYADGVAIAGAVGTSWTLPLAHEGQAIRCGDSNIIQVATPLTKSSLVAYWDFAEASAPFYSKRGTLSQSVGMTTITGADAAINSAATLRLVL